MGADDVFIGGLFGAGVLNDDESNMLKACEAEARKYFTNCPICGSGKIQVNVVLGGKDTLSCLGCGGRWHLYFGLLWSHLKWAKLELEGDEGEGTDLLGVEINADKLKEMATKSRQARRKRKNRLR